MTQTQKKLKEAWDAILTETDHTAKHGDHSSHSGYFNPESGCGEPPYTGEGLGAEEDLKEWEEFMKDPLAMFDWYYEEDMPELAKISYEKWLNMYQFSGVYVRTQVVDVIQVALVQKFVSDFYEVATGKSFEVVSF